MMKSVIYIMGVSGSGKTTIGKLLSSQLQIPFFDADDFHTDANKEKMKAGKALTDNDRQDWLLTINRSAQLNQQSLGAIFACSALKEKYRAILSANLASIYWIFLQGDYQTIKQRMTKRSNHFMPTDLLASQFNIVEMPKNALIINIVEQPAIIVEKILKYITV